MAAIGFADFAYLDYDSEVGRVRVHTLALTAANFDAQVALKATFIASLNLMTLGVMSRTMFGNEELLAVTPPAIEEAQRELKWLVSYHDATTLKRYSIEIPTAYQQELDPNDRAHAEIGDAGTVDGFVAALEAYAKSPTGGVVVVDEITLVGRPL
jgi:hypothetical protein